MTRQTTREGAALETIATQYEADGKPEMAEMFRTGGIDPSVIRAMLAFADTELSRSGEGKGPSAEHLQIALAKCETERDEAVNWSHLVDRHGTDNFDALADAWLAQEAIDRMHKAVGSVFSKWANDEIMERFRTHLSDIMHVAFVEGCLVGVRAEIALASDRRAQGDGER